MRREEAVQSLFLPMVSVSRRLILFVSIRKSDYGSLRPERLAASAAGAGRSLHWLFLRTERVSRPAVGMRRLVCGTFKPGRCECWERTVRAFVVWRFHPRARRSRPTHLMAEFACGT